MNLLALPRYQRLGPSSRVRFYQYFPALRERGFVIENAPFFSDEYVRRLYAKQPVRRWEVFSAYLQRLVTILRARDFDLLWLEKEFLPWMPAWVETMLARQPYVVDYDDAVFHRYDQHSSALVRRVLGRKIDRVMQNATLVVAGNEYLKERALAAGAKRVEILPSVVDSDLYASAPARASGFTVGWIGSPVTAPYLDVARPALEMLTNGGQAQVSLIGAGDAIKWENANVHILPWREESEIQNIQRFDVGIMPLLDEPFERGKCGYKLIQYMACGLPVIASPVGVNRQIVEHGVTGFLVKSQDEWLQALAFLRDNPGRRCEMGQAGRKKMEAEYSLQSTAPKLAALLRSAQTQ
ncbi:MAG: glycosyltransferase family 4 protein [Anaerolineae bacterium]|nr:glycosyltransferase family 4 protein [Anaerolineae bacterium]